MVLVQRRLWGMPLVFGTAFGTAFGTFGTSVICLYRKIGS
jgi:hypothetical protein